MIKLTEVTKTYVSKKKKQKVDALKGVSFELGNTGMVFILGKSGSGKSTLLNMLGGLDSPTSGEIVVDGVSMKDFKQADYEGYRNGYVGFIFQEYNLLDEFNVKDNVALALHLSKGDNVDGRVLEALQQVELTEDYLTRRVDEMSGGEKQRIAIARTIVKESKMILADEPTGNLDAATGESIWNILKEQSKSKLVVVVSHDRESAEKYGDRIIEIADGNVISDNGVKNLDDEVKETFTPQKKRLSFKTCLRMGVNSLFRHKVRSTCVLLLAILSILTLLITQLCLSYSESLTIAKFIRKYDVDYFTIEEDRVPRKDDLAFLNENSTNLKIVNNGMIGLVNSRQDIVDMGWSFVGEAMELDGNSYYVSTSVLKQVEELLDDTEIDYSEYYYYLDENDEKVYIPKVPSSWEFLVGKRTNIANSIDKSSILAGIVDVNSASDFSTDYIPEFFVLEDSVNYSPTKYVSFQEKDGVLDFGGGKQYSGAIELAHRKPYTDIVLTESGIVRTENVTVGDGEIIISYDMLEVLFDAKPEYDYVLKFYNSYELRDIPEQIGKTFPLVLYDGYGEVLADLGELKIVGVSFYNKYSPEAITAYISEKTITEINAKTCSSFLVRTSSVGSVRSFITKLYNNHSSKVDQAGGIFRIDWVTKDDCAYLAESFTEYIGSFVILTGSLSVIMTLILILLVTNLITLSITGRKKEIGILSALGTSNKDIAKIFIIETLVIAAITFVIVLIASLVFAGVFNQYFSSGYYKLTLTVPLFNVDILTIVTLAVASFGLLLIGALLPLRKITKLKPIDAIRTV